MTSAANLYTSVINDVVSSVKDSFLDEGVDENVLQELKTLWESKIASSKTIEHGNRSQEAMLESKRMHGGSRNANPAPSSSSTGALNGEGQQQQPQQPQLVVTDPDRLVSVQITIPAHHGNPHSAPRALTLQVPAHALQQSGPTSAVLQNLITRSLDLPESHAAVFLQEQINSAFRLRD